MKLGRLNHVGVATPSIEQSLELYREMFDAEPHGPAFDLPAQGVRVCFVDTPNSQIELIEPLGENSPIVKFLEKNPLGGQHHVCFEVPDIHAAKAEFEKGRDRMEAALEGAKLRLRPILMTSFAFILGCVPLWVASG